MVGAAPESRDHIAMNKPLALMLAALLASQPQLVHAQQDKAPAKTSEAPPAYGPKLYATPEEELAALRAFAARQKEAAKQDGPKRKLAQRRPTRLQVPPPPPPSQETSGYRPLPVPIPGPGVTPVVPSTPMPVHCVGATCIRADGVPLQAPVGNTSIDAAGRTCHQHGNFVQCF